MDQRECQGYLFSPRSVQRRPRLRPHIGAHPMVSTWVYACRCSIQLRRRRSHHGSCWHKLGRGHSSGRKTSHSHNDRTFFGMSLYIHADLQKEMESTLFVNGFSIKKASMTRRIRDTVGLASYTGNREWKKYLSVKPISGGGSITKFMSCI